jgi:hypothetical protein
MDNPSRLRLAATELLEKVQASTTDLAKAEEGARLVLERIRGQRAGLKAGEAKSVFGGLD